MTGLARASTTISEEKTHDKNDFSIEISKKREMKKMVTLTISLDE